jgi:hypothetical protein
MYDPSFLFHSYSYPYPEPMSDLLSQEQRHQLLELAEAHLRDARRGMDALFPYVDEILSREQDTTAGDDQR